MLNPYFRKHILTTLESHEYLFLNTFFIACFVFLFFLYKVIFNDNTFNKLTDKEKSILPSYHVLNVPNKFVFGFGLDYKGFGRSLPDLHIIN